MYFLFSSVPNAKNVFLLQIFGPESSGKTTLALHAIAEVQVVIFNLLSVCLYGSVQLDKTLTFENLLKCYFCLLYDYVEAWWKCDAC